VLNKPGNRIMLLMTDVNLAGRMSGVELAHIARARHPHINIVVTSGRPLSQPLPGDAKFWSKPWAPLDVLREAEVTLERTPRGKRRLGE